MLSFLHTCLRDEGGIAFKKAIVDTTLGLMETIPKIKVDGLNLLGDFIEDCEYPSLSVQVLHVIGDEAASTPSPGRFVRFIYNRTILEVPHVRAAAVTALAKIAASVEGLRDQILVLLRRCELDNDDEVRDRATMYTKMLVNKENPNLELVKGGLPEGISVRALEKAIIAYNVRPTDGEMKIDTLPIVSDGSGEVGYESELAPKQAEIGVDEDNNDGGAAATGRGGGGL